MGFFPERVFQNYDPVACKKFFDTHGNGKPDQIVVRGAENRDFRTYKATQYRGLAKELSFT